MQAYNFNDDEAHYTDMLVGTVVKHYLILIIMFLFN